MAEGPGRLAKITYYNIPCAWDIEASSWTCGGIKAATMYVWQMCVNGVLIMGRTWPEFIGVKGAIADALDLSPTRRLVIGVHNLAYDWQFLRRWMDWVDVFAVKERTPLKTVSAQGYEFRCTYLQSGRSLASLADALHTYRVRKAVGDLDYAKFRHSGTPLTPREVYYCVMDVVIVTAYLAEKIAEEGDITQVPLTKTGYVRRYVRGETIGGDQKDQEIRIRSWRYRKAVGALQMDTGDYLMMREAFQGGFTHASGLKAGRNYYNVASQDFTSSYPAVIVAERFPMTAPVDVTDKIQTEEDILEWSRDHYLLLDIGLVGVESTVLWERIIPSARVRDARKMMSDNGRLIYADRARMVITSDDYRAYMQFYRWTGVKVFRALSMDLDYLPTPFVKAVLELYKSKTELKGVAGQELLYNLRKEMLNSCYGMMVTDIIRGIIDYDNEEGQWKDVISGRELPDEIRDDRIDKNNSSYSRFLFYAWGLRVTSCARRNLYTAILSLGPDYIYSDTDSVKYRNPAAHEEYFARYNAANEKKMRAAMMVHGLPLDYWAPRNKKGTPKPLGAWDREPDMLIFKTLGAKRYLYMTKDRELHLTVAGVGKKIACDYLRTTYGKYGAFAAFADGLTIPAEHSGKLTHTYIDHDIDTVLTDYRGVTREIHERSVVHLEPAAYELSIADDYICALSYLDQITK